MKKFIALMVGLAAFLGFLTVPASAATRPAPVKKVAVSAALIKKVCATKGRSDALYWRYCMKPGTVEDAAREWYSLPVGMKGRENRDMENRRSICKFSGQFGGVKPAVRELWHDPAYDTYRNYKLVLDWTGRFAVNDCRAMGYRV